MSKLQRLALVSALLFACIGCDQATKHIASETLRASAGHSFLGDVFRLQYAENVGAFLSLGGTLPPVLRFAILTVGVGVLLIAIVVFAVVGKKLTRVEIAGYAVIAGGGLSNWIDRLTTEGRVVDFMNMGIGSLRTGVFNVADLAIIAGVAMVLLAKKAAPATPPSAA